MSDDMILTDEMVVPPTFQQLGILVLDGSGSMSEQVEGNISKADAVNIATRDLLTRLIASKNKRDFSIGVITFDTTANVRLPITRVCDDKGGTVDDNADYNPMNGHGGGTNLAGALEEAEKMATQFLSQGPSGMPLSVVVVVLSDGLSQTDPKTVANRIKQNERITLAATLFARSGDSSAEVQHGQTQLLSIVSSPTLYKTTRDSETLRKFFIASVSSGTGATIQ